jgi:phosphomannomutase
MSLMVSISGIRGIVGESLTPEVVVRYAAAFAEYCKGGSVVVGRDGRSTGSVIANLAVSTLLAKGSDVIAIGICPTPTVQLGVEKMGAAGGISVTASHNPMVWNGLKFLSSTGLFLNAEENAAFWAIADRGQARYAPWQDLGHHSKAPEMVDYHMAKILELPYVDARAIERRRFKVVVDCVNAAGSVIVPELLRKFGCTVIEINCDGSGVFAHDPEPIPENLRTLCERVVKEKADLGIAVDPDVDRLVLIDEHGHPIGEEYTIASVVKFVLAKEHASSPAKAHKVVVNLSTTRAVDDIAASYKAQVVRTPVGEINVAKRMGEIGAVIGGEGSGGVILPKVHLGRDAPVGIGLVLGLLAEFGGSLSELKSSLPQYAIVKTKVPLGSLKAQEVFDRLAQRYASEGRLDLQDGLKIDLAAGWIHLRKSNTEPIIRIITEAPTREGAERLLADASRLMHA